MELPHLASVPFQELLEKFAAGNHKPGSGSAAALSGLLSSAMARTVIDLTLRRQKYADKHQDFRVMLNEITRRIEPQLWQAFQEDSEQFAKVIASSKSARQKQWSAKEIFE
ncbi:MAG: cyclodeaminase/cyclohydrolase family protein [Planctomycetota bacterium]